MPYFLINSYIFLASSLAFTLLFTYKIIPFSSIKYVVLTIRYIKLINSYKI